MPSADTVQAWSLAIVAAIGSLYLVVSGFATFLPAAWPFTQACARFAADIKGVRDQLPKPPGAALLVLAAGLALGQAACAGSFEESKVAGRAHLLAATPVPPSGYCLTLDKEHRYWGAAAAGTSFAAGVAGLSTIPARDEKLELGLAIASVGLGTAGAVSAYISQGAATSWARDCSQ